MSGTGVGRNERCPCGSGRKYKHCCLQRAVTAQPAAGAPLSPALLKLLQDGLNDWQSGRLERAERSADDVLRALPTQPDAMHLKAVIAYSEGQHARALAWADRALAVARDSSVLSTRGLALQALGRMDESLSSFEEALALSPEASDIWCNLGAAQMQLALAAKSAGTVNPALVEDPFEAALASLLKAVECDPKSASVRNVLGLYWMQRGDPIAAERAFRDAVAIQPDFGSAWLNLGNACLSQQKLEETLAHYRQAIAVQPSCISAHDNLVQVLLQASRTTQAVEAAQAAHLQQPCIERRIQRDLLLPVIVESRAHMLAERARFEAALDTLLADGTPAADVSVRLFCPMFYLAYHGLDNLNLRVKLSRFYEQIHPPLRYEAPHVLRPPTPGSPLRIGFFSAFVHDHAVAHCFAATINRLSTDRRFTVHLITCSPLQADGAASAYGGFRGSVVNVNRDYLQARTAIATLELDVLVYQDVGMEFLSYFLAHARLARTQCVLGGHPETTGIRAVDYFLSTTGCEPPAGDAHYTETLVRLPRGVAHYCPPEVPEHHRSRRELGLPESGHLYLCPMLLQKLHPDFDAAIDGILAADPDGYVVLFEHRYLPWSEAVRRRLQGSVEQDRLDRVLFLPWVKDKADFIALHVHAGVVLDPFHFGMGSTAITTFAVNTPFVTWPGEFMRGRVGLDCCRLLGLDDCVADDWEDYIRKAVAIATGPERRLDMSRRIAESKHRFFDHERPSEDLAHFFLGLAHNSAEAASSTGAAA